MTSSFETSMALTEAEPPARPYGLLGLAISTIFILLATALLCFVAAGLAFAVVALALGWRPALVHLVALRTAMETDQTFVQRIGLIVSIVFYVAVSLAVLAAARIRGGAQWREIIALRDWNPIRSSRLFWIVLAAAIIYNFGATFLVSRLYPESNDWVTLPKGPLWVGVFVVLAVVFAPIAEELLFRGWLYSSLRGSIGVWAGLIVSSALFALAHWEKTHIYALAVFPVGLALGFVRERTGSLLASMTLHALYNAGASAVFIFGS